MIDKKQNSRPTKHISLWAAAAPLVVLIALLALVIRNFGSDAIVGGSQIALLAASSVAAMIAIGLYRCKWLSIENAIVDNIHTSASAIIILLLIGAIAGTWTISGIVPTFICYGMKILHPSVFLVAACIVCALVAIVTGSSWTTIATIGVALIGIGRAEGFEDGWTAGAIISGAYFGDKISALSDTTILASSTARVPLFEHIRYMLLTTIPSFVIALVVFAVASLLHDAAPTEQMFSIDTALRSTFHISPWLLAVPAATGFLISRRLPALITLFAAVVMACVAMLVAQPHLLPQICDADTLTAATAFKSTLITCYGSTAVDTGNTALNELIATSGMSGMLNTIWLILCAACFGGAMTGSGMLSAITRTAVRYISRPTGTVTATVGAGVFFNMCTADQYISLILTGNLYRDLYHREGYEPRLLSRSMEDSATVTSVLIPWNSCGMTQSTVLGVSTFVYFPYCIFNIVSPLMSIAMVMLGYKIYRNGEKISRFRLGRHTA